MWACEPIDHGPERGLQCYAYVSIIIIIIRRKRLQKDSYDIIIKPTYAEHSLNEFSFVMQLKPVSFQAAS